jgi:protoheme IX farnesyltransferase
MRRLAGMVLELAKVRIAVLATASAATGYFLAAREMSAGVFPLLAGVFLLAGGAGALNQVQEVDVDTLMLRTARRPIPSGRMTRRTGFLIALTMLAAGLLFLSGSLAAVMLGVCTVVWYNGIYTPLKRVSAFAAIPGGVVGALPPAIGWVMGGGSVADPRIIAVAFFFFVWQVPHFWLLLLRIGDDYARAGLPTLTQVFTRRQLSRIIYVWMLATAVACVSMPMFGVSSAVWAQAGLVLASVWLGWKATSMVRSDGEVLAFHHINLYALFVISVLSLSGLVG